MYHGDVAVLVSLLCITQAHTDTWCLYFKFASPDSDGTASIYREIALL